MARINLIQIRGGTAAAWTSANPILGAREPGVETDTLYMKFGDGVTVWASLPYASVSKAYVDALALGIVTSWKAPVKVATTVAGTLATSFENGDTIDGIALVTNDRILIKNQATQSENGIYIVNASGAPTRSTDANVAAELEGAAVTVQQGTANENTNWLQTTDGITLGSSNIVWVPLGAATTWGAITGTLSAQTDLQAALNLKANLTDVIGIQDLYYPAKGGIPRITGGCLSQQIEFTTSLVNIPVLSYDQTTQEFAQFEVVPPRKWNNGTITVVPYWTAQGGSGTVRWAISGGMYRNDDALTVALGTAQNSDDTLIATNDLHSGPETSAITLAGTAADGNLVIIQVARDPANDTLSSDAMLIGISIRFTTDAAKDG